MPAGLRSQTPINQTASKPWEAIVSHSADGTDERSTSRPYFRLNSESHTQVLISYRHGYRDHTGTRIGVINVSISVALVWMSPNGNWLGRELAQRLLGLIGRERGPAQFHSPI